MHFHFALGLKNCLVSPFFSPLSLFLYHTHTNTHTVLVRVDCYNILPQSGWLKQQIFITHSSRDAKVQDTLSDDLVSGESLLSGCTWFPFAVSSCGRDRDHLFQCFYFVSALIAFMKMGASRPQFSSVQSQSCLTL